MKRYSILNNLDRCFFCGRPAECIHEVYFGTANRQISIENGFCAGLCHREHIYRLSQYIGIEKWI